MINEKNQGLREGNTTIQKQLHDRRLLYVFFCVNSKLEK